MAHITIPGVDNNMSRHNPINDKPNYAKARLFGQKPEIPLPVAVKEVEERIDRWMAEDEKRHEKEKEEDAKPRPCSRLAPIPRSKSKLENYVYPTIIEDDGFVEMPAIPRSRTLTS